MMATVPDSEMLKGEAPKRLAGPTAWHTQGNQIVDRHGLPVRITAVSWFGLEMPGLAPNGLGRRNFQDMLRQIKQVGFNAVRLPYCNELFDPRRKPSGIDYRLNPELEGLDGLGIIDRLVECAGRMGLRIILDHHRCGAGSGPNSDGLWYSDAYPESRWLSDWVMLASRYAGNPTVVGADVHNEPHGSASWGSGDQATDWRLAAERAGNAILSVNPDWLIFVEGVEVGRSGHYWWGGNLSNAGRFPVRLKVPGRLVYSPHDYPASIYNQPWFEEPDYPRNLPAVWDRNWGYLFRENIAPVWLGEFGSRLATAKDRKWLTQMLGYLGGGVCRGLPAGKQGVSWAWWSWNPDSGDTGGILTDDWTSLHRSKVDLLTPSLVCERQLASGYPGPAGGTAKGFAGTFFGWLGRRLTEQTRP